MCISDKFPGAAATSGVGTTLWGPTALHREKPIVLY